MKNHCGLPYFLMTLLIFIFTTAIMAESPKTYILAVVPQLRPVEIYTRWTPFVEKLKSDLKIDIRIKTYPSIPQFEEDILKGIPDFAFMNPYHEVMVKSKQGYIPLVRDRTDLVGILVVKKESGIDSVQRLKNAKIAFPSPNAFAASLYMRVLLIEKEKLSFTPLYVKTHSNVYRNVLFGKTVAGGGVNNTLAREPEELKQQLKIIYKTPGTAPHPLSAHPRVPEKLRRAMVEIILKLAEDHHYSDMLNKIQIPQPMQADYRKDYLPLEKLDLKKYFIHGEE